jgi:hypothetical protein
LGLVRHALLGSTIPVLEPTFQLTSLVPDEVFIGFNQRNALPIVCASGSATALDFSKFTPS